MYLTCSAVLLSLLLSLQGGRDVNIPGPAGNPHLSTCPLQAAGLDAGGLEVRGTRSIWPVIMTTLRRERKQMHSSSNRLLPVTQQWYCMLKKFGFVHNSPTKTQPAASMTRKHSPCTRRGRKKKICARLKAWGWRGGGVCFKVATSICRIRHVIPATLGPLTKGRNASFSKEEFKCSRK